MKVFTLILIAILTFAQDLSKVSGHTIGDLTPNQQTTEKDTKMIRIPTSLEYVYVEESRFLDKSAIELAADVKAEIIDSVQNTSNAAIADIIISQLAGVLESLHSRLNMGS